MNKIYIVVLTSGSYSDWSMENVCAFLDPVAAELHSNMLQAQQDRRSLANQQKYEHMRVWYNDNPMPTIGIDDKRDWDKINHIKKKDRSVKQAKRLGEIEGRYTELNQLRTEHSNMRLEEEARFIRSLDYLTDEDKSVLTDKDHHMYYRTDGSYSVEEIELKG